MVAGIRDYMVPDLAQDEYWPNRQRHVVMDASFFLRVRIPLATPQTPKQASPGS